MLAPWIILSTIYHMVLVVDDRALSMCWLAMMFMITNPMVVEEMPFLPLHDRQTRWRRL
jgi:hypothetical protein